MRIVFMGTPDFAVPSLEALLAEGHEVCAVYTQPDKPVGRKQILTPPPVKAYAAQKGIPVCQPATLRDASVQQGLAELAPELIVVVAYGKLLPGEVLRLPRYGCINVHGSVLPKYRGAAPIQWTVINGEDTAGVTVMQMDEGLDTGDMLYVHTTPVDPDETSGALYERLSRIGAQALTETLEPLQAGTLTPQKQDSAQASHAPMLTKALSPIDWSRAARDIHNQVRGLQPWPVAQTAWNGKTLKLHRTALPRTQADKPGAAPGEVTCIQPLTVQCGTGTLQLLEVQLEGGKRMNTADFLRGNRMETGMLFR